ncbi:hypothetical protein CHH28_10125 [Bacterioplanes sanyensis]|uniref:Tat pathway signal protein n=1 Tax=Bacterioplanes sanyensis TaxID=1249553 RepID=A0A222FK40_9GAMM|nr:DUF1501 domain-containing protein [Bacterioplanes sanyensis]ASP39012.1 hypothetical protein CHH28_10125 [Bacterioplanes sanyensis]
MSYNRRQFLQASAAFGLGSLGASVMSFSTPASAAQSSDYKALVCVFLYGGLDNHDFVLPHDNASYSKLAAIRSELFQQQGGGRAQSALLALNADNYGDYGNQRFALASEMTGLQSLFEQGNLALVGNVGPLIEPTTRTSYEQQSVRLPPKLFSHNDQQNLWQANSPEGAFTGWGGLFGDIMATANANRDGVFTALSTAGNSVFLTGLSTQPFSISSGGGSAIHMLEYTDEEVPGLGGLLQQHFRGGQQAGDSLLAQDMAAKLSGSFDSNARYNQVRAQAAPLATEFPKGPLASQLKGIADAIAVRSELGVNRQVFFVGLGGFDTHSRQANNLPPLLGQIDQALMAFNNALNELGVADKVTTFTASDFGRTLAINGDGTDHGWGGHHLVMGGAVQGKRLYGSFPPPVYGHDQDSGGGRLIPTVAVEQYAATLGRWFGLNDSELALALPNLKNFSEQNLGFLA